MGIQIMMDFQPERLASCKNMLMGGLRRLFGSQQFGLILIILLLCALITLKSPTHTVDGHVVNNFLNLNTITLVLTQAAVIAIMAVGMSMVMISGGIDLSVGSTYALAGVGMAVLLQGKTEASLGSIFIGMLLSMVLGALCGWINGTLIVRLKVHPFIITLGAMMIFRGIAFLLTKGNSILVPRTGTDLIKVALGMPKGIYILPAILMVIGTIKAAVFLGKTLYGRRIYAVGGNSTAAQYSGIQVNRVLVGVYTICGICAGFAAWMAANYYGSASSGDGQGYELNVIAACVVGGVSLAGGKGTAFGAMLGAILIAVMHQAVTTLQFDANYEKLILGAAIIIAVVLDRISSDFSAQRAQKAQINQGQTS